MGREAAYLTYNASVAATGVLGHASSRTINTPVLPASCSDKGEDSEEGGAGRGVSCSVNHRKDRERQSQIREGCTVSV